jgi:hypothetical protein
MQLLAEEWSMAQMDVALSDPIGWIFDDSNVTFG